MDRFEAMAVFVAAVEGGSLSAAGRRLNMPLATVSRKISDLEAHLKTRLLNRSTRQLILTEAGRDYLSACREILERIDEAELTASGAYANARGQLVIAAPLVLGRLHLIPVIAEFIDAYPDVDVRLFLGDRNVNLLEEHIDLALRVGVLPDSSLIATQLGSIHHMVCASPTYLERFGTPLVPDDLKSHRCLTFEGITPSTEWAFGPAREKVPIKSRLVVNTAEAAISAAVEGAGVTRVLSYQVASAIAEGKLVRLLSDHEPTAIPVSLIYVGGGRLPMKSRAFIDFAVPRLRSVLPPVQ
jgi:DNA-binding transcriptional LysR family regulator